MNQPNSEQFDSHHQNTTIVVKGNGRNLSMIPQEQASVTIGRFHANDIVLENGQVSRYHARLERVSNGWQVIDLSSSNGTLTANGRLTPDTPTPWQPKQPIHIGPYAMYWLNQAASNPILIPAPQETLHLESPSQSLTPEPALAVINSNPHPAQLSLSGHAARIDIIPDHAVPIRAQMDGAGVLTPPAPPSARWKNLLAAAAPPYLLTAGLGLIWLLVLLGIPKLLPDQIASWLTFIALLITPGYLLGHIITWRSNLDWFEQLALAFPLGLTVITLPGIISLLLHLTLSQLTTGWVITSILVGLAWLLHGLQIRAPSQMFWGSRPQSRQRWGVDELILLGFLVAAFIFIMPTLSLYKIDGDALAVGTFTADALANLPLNEVEPLFGTSLGPGVRMIFNQALPMFYLWTYLAEVDAITLTAAASRNIIAIWTILAACTLGKAAGGSRRFGLYTAAVQLLIYLIAPFWRGDNVSLFFFERTNADKFMVLATMLPVVFAFAIRYVRDGYRRDWLAAAAATLAVSAIHPLIAAMLALGLGAFGATHLLVNLRQRLAWQRVMALAGIVGITMFLPIVQLVLSRGEAPLAPSYPSSFEGWSMGEKMIPVLPFFHTRSITPYGPLPDLAQLEASAANGTANPFLIWRFAVNVGRQRLIFFDINHYISDPRLLLEPAYLLALFLLIFLVKHIRHSIATQFVVGVTAGVLLMLFNPILTPLIGSLVMPWILWRFVWLLPYALIIALATHRLLTWVVTAVTSRRYKQQRALFISKLPLYKQTALVGFILIVTLIASPSILKNIETLNHATPNLFPTPQNILERLDTLTADTDPALVLADQSLSVTIPAFVANANVLAHRIPNTSEIFPADMQDVALQRIIDQHLFFNSNTLTTESIDILQRYEVGYVVVASGSNLDLQLRLASQSFEWLLDDQSYTLYSVQEMPEHSPTHQGNTALEAREWETAVSLYTEALANNPDDLLAQIGLVESAQARGQFDHALEQLQLILTQNDAPILHYRLGQFYAERGSTSLSIDEFATAQTAAPHVARFHIALGDACLQAQDADCAATQYNLAAANEIFPDEAARLIAEADLWRQQGQIEQGLPLYKEAATLNPSFFNQFILEGAYRELGQWDHAEAVLTALENENHNSAAVMAVTANTMAAQNRIDEAITLYRRAIKLQNLQAQETTNNRLALAQLLWQNNQADEALNEVALLLGREPYNAAVYRLQGDIFRQQQQFDDALGAYRRAFTLDPEQVASAIGLSDQLRQNGARANGMLDVLETAVNANPDAATLFLTLGDYWQRQGAAAEAIDAYHTALTLLDPSHLLTLTLRPRGARESRAVAYARLARTYEDQGELEPAMSYFQATVSAAPNVAWTHVLLGDAWQRRNEPDSAAVAYQQAIERDATYVSAYIQLAELNYASGEQEAGDLLYEQALQVVLAQVETQPVGTGGLTEISLQPTAQPAFSDEAWEEGAGGETAVNQTTTSDEAQLFSNSNEQINTVRMFAQLRQVSNQTDDAITLYQQQIERGEANGLPPAIMAQYHKGLGDLYQTRNEYSEAAAAYRAAISFDSWWPEARLGLAEALAGLEDNATALEYLQSTVAIVPGSAEAQLALAVALEQQGNDDDALAIYRTTAQAHPGDARVTLALARALQSRNVPAEAEQIFQQTITLNANTVDAYVGLAELSMAEGRLSEAETYLQQALATNSQNINIYFRFAELEQQRGHADAALDWYQRAAALPQIEQFINITLIDSLIQQGDYTTALSHIETSLLQIPGHNELLLRLGRVQQRLGQFDEAAATFANAIELNDGDSRLLVEQAEFYLSIGEPQKAVAAYQQAIDLEPTESSYYLAENRIWQVLGNFNEAKASLWAGLDRADETQDLYTALADIFLLQGDPEQAINILQQGSQALGENLTLQLATGAYHESRADFVQAQRLYRSALELWPEATAVQIALADLYLRQEDTANALTHYQDAVTLDATDPSHYLALGNAYSVAGRIDEAILAYEQALALSPTLENGYVSLGTLYEAQSRWEEAQAVYEQGLAMVPYSRLLLTQLGLFWMTRGDNEQALTSLDQAATIAPTAATLIARASVYDLLGEFEGAERDLLTAVQTEPGSIDALIALGDWYIEQNDETQAEQYYKQAVALMPGVPTGYLRLSNLAIARGNIATADQYEAAAEAADPGAFIREPQ